MQSKFRHMMSHHILEGTDGDKATSLKIGRYSPEFRMEASVDSAEVESTRLPLLIQQRSVAA